MKESAFAKQHLRLGFSNGEPARNFSWLEGVAIGEGNIKT